MRLGDERTRDRYPHAHAARQFARIGAGEVPQADAIERRRDALACLGGGNFLSLSGSRTLWNTFVQGMSVGS